MPLPEGFRLLQDSDGDWWLLPPKGVTIFTEPGEGWLVTDDFMVGSWDDISAIEGACMAYLGRVGIVGGGR